MTYNKNKELDKLIKKYYKTNSNLEELETTICEMFKEEIIKFIDNNQSRLKRLIKIALNSANLESLDEYFEEDNYIFDELFESIKYDIYGSIENKGIIADISDTNFNKLDNITTDLLIKLMENE